MQDEATTISVSVVKTADAGFLQEVIEGLSRPEKRLPSKYFYDHRGSKLFDQICLLDEYYLTRTELQIMETHAAAMARQIGPDAMLIEFGSGSSTKTRLLLDELPSPAAYIPVDVSREHLQESAERLNAAYPALEVLPVCADFTAHFALPASRRTPRRRVVYFPGSTIGNFAPAAVDSLLDHIAGICGPAGALLIGIDLKKDAATLEAAYNDRRGVTAEFNYNLLRRINRELGADFQVDQFRHEAIYRESAGRIEMHLVSQQPQVVSLGGRTFEFSEGETICTEYSHKYSISEFSEHAAHAGFALRQSWTDPTEKFAVLLYEVHS